ncbi:MAG: phosphoribosyltransferase family protein [Candidatus Eisenbacteria bacterium]
MKPYLCKIDTAATGGRNDVTPLFADAECFGQLVEDLTRPFQNTRIDCVACIEALGFILGTAIARRLAVGVVPIRKGGKLPVDTDGLEFRDYSGDVKRLEIRRDAFPPGARVLLVDEWIETGAQIQAAAAMIEAREGTVVGIATIRMDANDQTAAIGRKYRVCSAWGGRTGRRTGRRSVDRVRRSSTVRALGPPGARRRLGPRPRRSHSRRAGRDTGRRAG